MTDALSRLPMTANQPTEESFLNRRVFQDAVTFPLDLKHIAHLQSQESNLPSNEKLSRTKVNGVLLYTIKGKVFVPKKGREPVVQWYHESLQHSGPERTSSTLRAHFDWPGAAEEVKRFVRKCDKCQKFKITGVKKYGKIPLLQEEESLTPFDVVHLDMIGPWGVKFSRGDKTFSKDIKALTIVDRASNWPEIVFARCKESEYVAKLFDKQWLCRYPRPKKVVHDNSGEFTGFEFQEMCASYGIEAIATTVKNPRSNSTAERMHLTVGDMLRTMTFAGDNWEEEVEAALHSVAWAIRSTISTMSGYTPGQLVFSKDMIMQSVVTADWEKLNALRGSHPKIRTLERIEAEWIMSTSRERAFSSLLRAMKSPLNWPLQPKALTRS